MAGGPASIRAGGSVREDAGGRGAVFEIDLEEHAGVGQTKEGGEIV